MKAIVHMRYGTPDVLQLKDVEKPVPEDDKVLVEVCAASLNKADYHEMRGGMTRFFGSGLLRPKDPRLGIDVSGRVVAVGRNVSQFRLGDEVFGGCAGAFAEYALAREDRLVLKPADVSFDEAAATPVAALTALQGLRDKGKIQPGQGVLVNGASGGVGTFAIQIAKSFGAEVTGVCSTRNLDAALALGADHVLDYTREDFTRSDARYDLVFDVASNRSVSDYRRALKPKGICVVVGFSSLSRLFEHLVLGPLSSGTSDKKVGFMGIAKILRSDLLVLQEMLQGRKVTPAIEKRYPLSETPEAMQYLGEGHARGKLVIMVDHGGYTRGHGAGVRVARVDGSSTAPVIWDPRHL